MRFHAIFFALLAGSMCLAACDASNGKHNSEAGPAASADLASFFDCMRENGKVAISAHRGGPEDGYAENTIPTFQHTIDAGFALLEMDIRQSADGKLFLYHDDELGRVGVGSGKVDDMNWDQLTKVVLKDNSGTTTTQHMPLFADVLKWAKDKKVIIQVDFKRGLPFAPVIDMIRKNGMAQRVVLISYTTGQAKRLRQLAPEMMISAGGQRSGPIAQILQDSSKAGSARYFLAWMGTDSVKPARYAQLRRMGIEPIQGTMGHLDRFFASRPNSKGYNILEHEGVVIFATNRVHFVRDALKNDEDVLSVCALPTTK